MFRLAYSLLFYLCVPFALLRLLWRSRREPGYRRHVRERFGFVRALPGGRRRAWIHAVSAGETIAAVPLARRLVDSGFDILFTNMTPAGRERVEALLGDRVANAFVPWDLPDALARFLARVRPSVLVIIDTELWPNMIHCTAAQGIPVILVNGRLSASSYDGYRRLPRLVRPMLSAVSRFCVQTASHRDRFVQLGVPQERIALAGSIKFDNDLPADLDLRVARLRSRIGERRVLLGASTHPGEESALLDVLRHAGAWPDCLLVIAPRHVHRSDALAATIAREFTVQRFSEGAAVEPATRVLLIDAMGELLPAYGIAGIAFVGGSLAPVGGHNLIEAAMMHVPVIMGPHVENIEDIAEQFVEAGGMRLVPDAGTLVSTCIELMRDEVAVARLVASADDVVARNRGALDRVVATVREFGE